MEKFNKYYLVNDIFSHHHHQYKQFSLSYVNDIPMILTKVISMIIQNKILHI